MPKSPQKKLTSREQRDGFIATIEALEYATIVVESLLDEKSIGTESRVLRSHYCTTEDEHRAKLKEDLRRLVCARRWLADGCIIERKPTS